MGGYRSPRGAGCGGVRPSVACSPGLRHPCADASLPVGPAAIYSPAHAPSARSARRLVAAGDTHTHTRLCAPRATGAQGPGGPTPAPKISAVAGGSAAVVAPCHLAGPRLAGPARTSRGLLEVLVNTVTHRCCPPAPVSLPRCPGPWCAGPAAHHPLPGAQPGPHSAGCRVGVMQGDTPHPRWCHRGHLSTVPCGTLLGGLSPCPLPKHIQLGDALGGRVCLWGGEIWGLCCWQGQAARMGLPVRPVPVPSAAP